MEAGVRPTARPESTQHPRRLALCDQAEALLRGGGYLALRGITCEVRDGVAHLHGHLPTYHLKQIAQSIVSGVDGVRRVVNHIEVRAPAGRAPDGVSRVTTRTGEAY